MRFCLLVLLGVVVARAAECPAEIHTNVLRLGAESSAIVAQMPEGTKVDWLSLQMIKEGDDKLMTAPMVETTTKNLFTTGLDQGLSNQPIRYQITYSVDKSNVCQSPILGYNPSIGIAQPIVADEPRQGGRGRRAREAAAAETAMPSSPAAPSTPTAVPSMPVPSAPAERTAPVPDAAAATPAAAEPRGRRVPRASGQDDVMIGRRSIPREREQREPREPRDLGELDVIGRRGGLDDIARRFGGDRFGGGRVRCPFGYFRDPRTFQCIPRSIDIGGQVSCPAGTYFDIYRGRCRRTPLGFRVCPSGFYFDAAIRACSPLGRQLVQCGVGQVYDYSTNTCRFFEGENFVVTERECKCMENWNFKGELFQGCTGPTSVTPEQRGWCKVQLDSDCTPRQGEGPTLAPWDYCVNPIDSQRIFEVQGLGRIANQQLSRVGAEQYGVEDDETGIEEHDEL